MAMIVINVYIRNIGCSLKIHQETNCKNMIIVQSMSSLFTKSTLVHTHFTGNNDGYFIVNTITHIRKCIVNYSKPILRKSLVYAAYDFTIQKQTKKIVIFLLLTFGPLLLMNLRIYFINFVSKFISCNFIIVMYTNLF